MVRLVSPERRPEYGKEHVVIRLDRRPLQLVEHSLHIVPRWLQLYMFKELDHLQSIVGVLVAFKRDTVVRGSLPPHRQATLRAVFVEAGERRNSDC